MQQRRGRNKPSDLPMTTADASRLEKRSQQYTNSKSRRPRGSPQSSPFILLFLFVVITFGIVSFIKLAPDIVSSKQSNNISSPGFVSKPLSSKFPSLNYALKNSEIVLLYFAASWCPESTGVSKKLDYLFSSPHSPLANKVLLPPDQVETSDPSKNMLSIVYVSSDTSKEEMEGYIRSNWIGIPFDSTEKNDIKKHFRTCAKIEIENLQIDPRRFEIPTVLVIDSLTEAIISYTGIQEIDEYNDDVLDHWLGIRDLMRGLDSKYSEE